ncbi:MAG TPA: ABC transporter permease [Acidimicrobiales bacterium]|nr:ABC transporter permease [Acidimicrobiales bacterium]
MGGHGFIDDQRVRQAAGALAAVLAFYFVLQRFWPSPLGVLVQGLVIGGLTALLAFGIALIYRANRIVNFAGGDLGALPASLAVLLIVGPGVPYFLALPIGLAAAIVLGAVIDFLVIRRFFTAPRLVLTVVTIAVSLLLGFFSLILPAAFDIRTPPQSFPSPFDVRFSIGRTVFSGNDVIAMVAVVALIGGLGAFFRYTNIGIAVRATAEGAERASLLGVPVKRIGTIVWIIATVLATTAVFLRAGVVGLPFGQLVGPALLVRALAAAVVGRMERFPVIFVASLALGVLESSIIFSTGRATLVDPILFVVIVTALLLQRRGTVARTDERSSWQSANDVRPIPKELRSVPEVRWGVAGVRAGLLLFAVALPVLLSEAQISLVAVILMTAMVGLSLVVLTGWAGQVSLGQVAFFGIGAAVGAHVTTALGWDLSVAFVVAGAAGAGAAMVIGVPALRIRGLYLAVITLAFALATSAYLLNPEFIHWLPQGRFDRPFLFGRIALDTESRFYYLVLAALLLTLAAMRGLRNSRTGRVLFAVRENERAAQAFGVNAVAAKLTAFAFSGFIAASAGSLYVHHQQGLATQSFGVARSIQVFVEVVLGGLGSPAGAIIGVVFIEGLTYFRSVFPETIRAFLGLLTSSLGVIVVLMVLPGGLSQGLYGVRDRLLRLVADRRGIMVPSLFADGRVEAPSTEETVDEAVLLLGDDLHAADGHAALRSADDTEVIELAADAEVDLADEAPRRRRREPLRAGRTS